MDDAEEMMEMMGLDDENSEKMEVEKSEKRNKKIFKRAKKTQKKLARRGDKKRRIKWFLDCFIYYISECISAMQSYITVKVFLSDNRLARLDTLKLGP